MRCLKLCHYLSWLFACLLAAGLFIINPAVHAQSSVWQISKNNKTLYLGGSIHILGQDDYPLPNEFDQAFANAGKVVFETDMAAVRSPDFAQKMMLQMRYPPGQSLKDVLNDSTYQRLSDYFSGKMPMSQIDVLRPGMVVIMLSALEFQRLGMVVAGVDEYFWRLAGDENKAIDVLESADEQLAFIRNMGQGHENDIILKTLDEIEQTESIIVSLKMAWRTGDETQLEQLFVQEMIEQYPRLYEDLLVRRNMNWLPTIEAMLETDEVELVLVGTLHLIGDDGLLQLLRDKGYKVAHFQP